MFFEPLKRFSLSSLHSRLIFLVLLAVVPAFGLVVYTANENIALKEKEISADSYRITHLAADRIAQIIEGERNLLISLSEIQAVKNLDSHACSKNFANIKKHLPLYANLFAFKPSGDVFCSVAPLVKIVNAYNMTWFQRTINTGAFSIGEYQMGKITGRPVLVSGYPVINNAGQIKAVVGVSIDLYALNKVLSKTHLPEGASLTLLDSKGVILARYPEHEKWMGKLMPDAEKIKTILHQHEGTAEVAGVDGIKRVYSFISVEGTNRSLYLSIGIPTSVAFASVHKALARNLILLGLFAALALTAAWITGNLSMRSENALRESEEKFHLLFESANDGIFILDLEGKFIDVNRIGYERLGYAKDEMLAKNIRQFDPPEFAVRVSERLAQILKHGQAVFESAHYRKDGTIMSVEINSRIIDYGGGKCFFSIIRDITERKIAEESLIKQSQLLESFFSSTVICSALLDKNFNFIRVNEAYAKADNRSVSEFPGHNHFEFYPSEAEAIFEQVVKTKKMYQVFARPFIYPGYPERGVTYWDWSLGPVLDRTGEVELLVFTLVNVTERMEAEQELRKLNEELEQRVKERTLDLERKIAEIERLNKLFVGRELDMIELKKKIKDLEGPSARGKKRE